MRPRSTDRDNWRWMRRAVLATVAVALALGRLGPSRAQEEPADPADLVATARYITLESPITDEDIGWVRRTALELQDIAAREGRDAYLILEVQPGTSQFHHVYALAEFLTSSAIPDVTTVAWVPETVVGHNAVVPLACNEIIMHPDAELGDIGLGQALDPEQQTIIRNLIAKRRNKKVNEYLATALMDPSSTLVQLSIEPQPGMVEKRVVTETEADKILRSGVVIQDRHTIKDAGTPFVLSGESARNYDILVVRTARERRELIDAYSLPPDALRELRAPGEATTISLIAVEGVIDEVMETFLLRQMDRAVSSGATTIIFEITSPGGLLYPSRDLAFAVADLEARNVRTIAYVHDGAYSGAAFIALGCDEIYLTHDAKIGDILPIETRAGQAFERAPEKVLSPLLEWLSDIAELKGRPRSVVMAMADPEIEVFEVTNSQSGSIWYMSEDELHEQGDEWVRGQIVPESRAGLPMTIGARRAHELKIAEAPVTGFDELKQRVGISPDVNPFRVGRTWVDDFIFTLNHPFVTGLLFFVGIVCIYLELHFMTGLLGIVSALCFGVFFWSKVLGGTAGYLEIVLFLIGLGCIAMEIFVIPGFGVFGVSGGLMIFAALIMASQTFGNLEPGHDIDSATTTVGTLSGAVFAVIVMAMLISRFLPQIPILNQLILSPPGSSGAEASHHGPRLRPELSGVQSELVGRQGTALTVLRPAGKAHIGDELHDVVSDGPYIEEGTPIEVVRVAGNRIVVRQI